MQTVKLLPLETHNEGKRGNTLVIENPPFCVRRIFCIYDVDPAEIRGGHAHKKCEQLLIAVHGAILVKVTGGCDYVLDNPNMGLYVPPKFRISLTFLDEGATLMVLASEKYDEKDYIGT